MQFKGNRKQYTKEEALQKYKLHCHTNGLIEKSVNNIEFDNDINLIRLTNTDELVYAFTSEIELDY